MRTRFSSLLLAGCLAAGLALPIPAALETDVASASPQSDVDKWEKEVKRLEALISSTKDQRSRVSTGAAAKLTELDAITSKLRDEEAQLEDVTAVADQAQAAADAAAEVVAAAQAQLDAANKQVQVAVKELRKHELRFTEQVGTAYKYGDRREMLLLQSALDGESLTDVSRNLRFVQDVLDTERELVVELAQARSELDIAHLEARRLEVAVTADKLVADRASEAAEAVRAAQEELTVKLQETRDEHKRQLDGLQAEEVQLSSKINTLNKELSTAKKNLAQARARRDAANGNLPTGGGITCPVPTGSFYNDWGNPRSGGRTHKGNDVFADRWDPVYSPIDGVVRKVDHTDTYVPGSNRGDLGGRSVSIYTHDRSQYWYLAHLQTITSGLRVGDVVYAGMQIGTTGNSGNAYSTPPHTHIGLYRYGTAINPYHKMHAACPNH